MISKSKNTFEEVNQHNKNTFEDVFFVEIFAFVKVFHILFDAKMRGLFSPNINFSQNAVIMLHLGNKINS